MSERLDQIEVHYRFVKSLSEGARQLLSSAAQAVTLSPKTSFLIEGSAVDSLLLLERGELRVFKTSASGREITLYRVRPGECCVLGMSGLLANAPYSAHVEATAETTALAIEAGAFRRLFDTDESTRRMVMEQLNGLLTGLMTLVAEVAFRKMDERLGGFLLEEAGVEGTVEASHEEIAGHIGTAREVVSRLLENFRDDGLIRVDRRQVHVVDREGLARIRDDRSLASS